MNKFYTQLTLSAPLIDYKSIWPNDPTDPTDTIPRWQPYPILIAKNTFWTEEIRSQLTSQDLIPQLVRIFRWKPKSAFHWHVDGSYWPNEPQKNTTTTFAINWVIEGTGMIYWNSKLDLPKTIPYKTTNKFGDPFHHLARGTIHSKPDDEYETSCLGNGCLVNTTIPHKVVNDNSIHRITISIQFGNHLSYEKAYEKLLAVGFVK
jgi:hypothetical protein